MAEHFCIRCRTPFLNEKPLDEAGLCRLCSAGVTGFDAAYSYGAYDGRLRELIHLFKYDRIRTLAKPLGVWLSGAFPRDQRFDALVPAPLHWTRMMRRGFNQSGLLAKEVSRNTGVPVERLLTRRKRTATQALLTNAQRRTNVAAAFRVTDPLKVDGKRLLVIDDVMTTGATSSACSAALKRAGAARVSVLTLARADRRGAREFLEVEFNSRELAGVSE